MTRGAWKSLWYDSDSIDPPAPIVVDREQIFQVVEDGFYYNVAAQKVPGPNGTMSDTQYFLKGNYQIARALGNDNEGQFALNIIDLEFADSVSRPGQLPAARSLIELVQEVDGWVETGVGKGVPPFAVPGPAGRTGYLFNLFIDEDLRIAGGLDGDDPDGELSLFVLRRTDTAGPAVEVF